MSEFLQIALTALLGFMSADYTLRRATVKDPLRAIIAAVFAVLLVVIAGVLGLGKVIG